jgi:hypothetical protein
MSIREVKTTRALQRFDVAFEAYLRQNPTADSSTNTIPEEFKIKLIHQYIQFRGQESYSRKREYIPQDEYL